MHIPPDRPGNLYKQRRQISNFLEEMIKSKFHQELKTFKNTLNYLIILIQKRQTGVKTRDET